jgi:DNA-binding NtrC family response regulator
VVGQAEKALPSLSGLSLLVVDDDPSVVRGMTRVLGRLGAEVTGVGSVREARVSLGENAPDAVLADLQLEDGTGLELLPDYLGRQPAGAFYMITGHGSVDNAVEALRQGARHYFEKPVDPVALARHLADDIHRYTGQQPSRRATRAVSDLLRSGDEGGADRSAALCRQCGACAHPR